MLTTIYNCIHKLEEAITSNLGRKCAVSVWISFDNLIISTKIRISSKVVTFEHSYSMRALQAEEDKDFFIQDYIKAASHRLRWL